MSKPMTKITRTIRSEQLLNAFVEIVRKNLPLDLQNTRITTEDILANGTVVNVSIPLIEARRPDALCRDFDSYPI